MIKNASERDVLARPPPEEITAETEQEVVEEPNAVAGTIAVITTTGIVASEKMVSKITTVSDLFVQAMIIFDKECYLSILTG